MASALVSVVVGAGLTFAEAAVAGPGGGPAAGSAALPTEPMAQPPIANTSADAIHLVLIVSVIAFSPWNKHWAKWNSLAADLDELNRKIIPRSSHQSFIFSRADGDSIAIHSFAESSSEIAVTEFKVPHHHAV